MKSFTNYIKENKQEGHDEFLKLTNNLYTGISIINILLDEEHIDGTHIKEGLSYEDVNHILKEHLGMV